MSITSRIGSFALAVYFSRLASEISDPVALGVVCYLREKRRGEEVALSASNVLETVKYERVLRSTPPVSYVPASHSLCRLH